MYPYIYLCVCVYVYIHTYIHTFIYIYTYIDTSIYIYIYIHTYKHMHTYVHTYIYIYCLQAGGTWWSRDQLFVGQRAAVYDWCTGWEGASVSVSVSVSVPLSLSLSLSLCLSALSMSVSPQKKNYQNIFFLSPGSCVGCEGGREERARTRGFRARAPQWKRCCGGYCCDW